MADYNANSLGVGELNRLDRVLLARSFGRASADRRKLWLMSPPVALAVYEMQKKIELEVTSVCDHYLPALDSKFYQISLTTAEKVFYHKLKGDLNRCLGDVKNQYAAFLHYQKAFIAYNEAQDIATSNLDALDPVRMDAEMTFKRFKFEILSGG